MRRALAVYLCAGAVAIAGTLSRVASADDAGALVIYNEALKLMEERRYDEACPRFETSFRMAPTSRAKMAVALCHERAGRIATAWAAYREAARLAKQANDEVSREAAQTRAGSLEARMPRLVVTTHGEPDVAIRIDGETRPPETIAQALPVDPGAHVVRAEGTAKVPFEQTVTIREGELATVAVPKLEPDAASRPPGGSAVSTADGASAGHASSAREPMPWWGWGSLGLAAVSTGVGVGFGVSALSSDDRARELCPNDPCSVREGVDASERADTHAWIANVAVGSAIVLAGVGVAAWLTRAPVPSASAGARSLIIRF